MHRPEDDRHGAESEARHRLVADLAEFLDGWRQALARQALPTDPAVISLQQRALALRTAGDAAGFGGISHHLARCHQAVEARNFSELTESLSALAELKQQAQLEVSAARSGKRYRPQAEHQDAGDPAPPRMVTAMGADAEGHQAGQPLAPPPLAPGPQQMLPTLLSSGVVRGLSDQAPAVHAQPGAPQVPPPLHAPREPPALSAPAVLPAPGQPPPGQAPAPHAPIRPAVLHFPSEPPPQASPPGVQPPPVVSAPAMPAASPPSKPQLDVRTMFGLRAFGREPRSTSPPEAGGSSGSPSLLGLKSRRHTAPKSAVPPPLLQNDPSGLPRLPDADTARAPAARPKTGSSPEVRQFLDRMGDGRKSEPPRPTRREPQRRRSRGVRTHRRDQGSGAGWIVFGASAVGIGVLVMVGVLVFGRRDAAEQPKTAASAPVASSNVASATEEQLPRPKLSSGEEQLKSLMVQIHGRKMAPELRAYVDEDAALVARALTSDCKGKQTEVCNELTETFVDQKPLTIKKRKRRPGPRAGWLRGLKLPKIPIEDDPRVKRQFEFYTQNPVGRETFQAMLFRCGAYKDLIQSTLVKYDLPVDVMAVVFAESSCLPRAESPAGAVGLWQFIPASARAYHLRVKDGVVDERMNPFKSTEAGVRYMADMFALFGEWDLVFASYNMGPFGLMARLERAGGDVGYWDLVDAKLLPEETEHYAPAIQALALILNNLRRLKFSTSQMKPPQLTADLEAPPGTRLGMVARAAAMSEVDLRKLNLDIMGENIPNLPGGFSVQVPKDVVWQARETLAELMAARDDADLCVSPAFDWGKRQFTTEMAEACHRKLSVRSAQPAAAAADPAQ